MNINKRTLGILMCCLVISVAGLYKLDTLYEKLSKVRNQIVHIIYPEVDTDIAGLMKEKKCDIDSLYTLEDERGAWYTKYHFIAHAGGGIEGRIYTNSLEAWEHSYECGTRVFDVDMSFTEDEKLVLRHSWADNIETGDTTMRSSSFKVDMNGCAQYRMPSEIMTYDDFMATKIFHKFTPMDCKDMITFMAAHDDLYVACDMKGNNVLKGYQYLVDTARTLENESVLDRIIVNVYDYEIYDKIMDIYQFKNTSARQHFVSPNNYYELAEFCVNNNIHVVNVSACFIEDEEIQMLKSKGIHIYVAIADFVSDMQYYHDNGADGAVTNWLYETDWNYLK